MIHTNNIRVMNLVRQHQKLFFEKNKDVSNETYIKSRERKATGAATTYA